MSKKRVSQMGYRDDSPYRNRKSIKIHTPNGLIDMSNTGIPLIANGRYLAPYSGMHQFDTTEVTEVPMQAGGFFQNPYKTFEKAPVKYDKKKFSKAVTAQLKADQKRLSNPTQQDILEKAWAKEEEEDNILDDRFQAIRRSDESKTFKEQMQNSAAGEKLRFFPNDADSFIDDYLNPFRMIGSMADDLSRTVVNPESTAGDYVRALGTPLAVGAFAGLSPTTPGQFVNNVINPLAGFPVQNIPKGVVKAGKIIADDIAQRVKEMPLNTLSKAKNLREVVGVAKGIPTPASLPRMGRNELRDARVAQELGRMESSGKKFYDIIDYATANLSDEAFAKSFNGSKEQMTEYANRYRVANAPNPSIVDARLNDFPPIPEQLPNPPAEIHLDPNQGARESFGTFNTEDEAWDAYQARRTESGLGPADRASHQYLPEVGSFADLNLVRTRGPYQQIPIGNPQLPEEAFDQFEQRFINGPESASAEPATYNQLNMDDADYDAGRRIGQEDPWARLQERQREAQRARFTPLQRAKNDVNEGLEDFNDKVLSKVKNAIGDSYSAYPVHRGNVKMNLPSLFMDTEGKKAVEQSISSAARRISPGEVATGSTNTSHSSWLPQVKQVFGYTEGKPQFLGYQKMNYSGYLTQAGYKPGEIGSYLNTELDDLMRRGKLPKNVLRPYEKNGQLMLPQYGVKKLQYGGFNNAQDIYNYLFDDSEESREAVSTTPEQDVPEVEGQPKPQEVNHEELMIEAVAPERNRYRERMMREGAITATDGIVDGTVSPTYGGAGTYARRGSTLPTSFNNGSIPITATTSTVSNAPVSNKGKFAFDYLVNKKGLAPHVAAGMIGNFVQESGNFRDDVITGRRKGDNGRAVGIAQWHPDRWSQGVKYITAQGMNPYSLEGQLEFAVHEAGQRGDLDRTAKARNSAEAANIFGKYYERPKILDSNRARYAQAYHYQYGGLYNDLFKTEQ